ncbi:hypothetical protein HD554DRAFT_2081083 [Boletus coccyginus]|nr:hypothetical protein HD554DRAFT_2081083 [Boletus coccyginus]
MPKNRGFAPLLYQRLTMTAAQPQPENTENLIVETQLDPPKALNKISTQLRSFAMVSFVYLLLTIPAGLSLHSVKYLGALAAFWGCTTVSTWLVVLFGSISAWGDGTCMQFWRIILIVLLLAQITGVTFLPNKFQASLFNIIQSNGFVPVVFSGINAFVCIHPRFTLCQCDNTGNVWSRRQHCLHWLQTLGNDNIPGIFLHLGTASRTICICILNFGTNSRNAQAWHRGKHRLLPKLVTMYGTEPTVGVKFDAEH